MRMIPTLLTAILVASSTPGRGADVSLRNGHPFPDIHLPSLEDGKLTAMSSFRGKKTLLLVFASW